MGKRGPKPRTGVLRNKYGDILCEHKRTKRQCVECGGKCICEHKRRRSVCWECKILGTGGKSLCEHGRVRIRCKDCGGSQVCEHDRIRTVCKECGGTSSCNHLNESRECVVCDPKSVFKRMGRRAKGERGISFDFSYEDFLIFVTSPCFYCDSPSPNGIDRIDSSAGYVLSNCRSCCKICNIMKMAHPEQTFFEHIRKILCKHDSRLIE
jgi:hypothetical protein